MFTLYKVGENDGVTLYKKSGDTITSTRGEIILPGVTPAAFLTLLLDCEARPKYDTLCLEVKEHKTLRKDESGALETEYFCSDE